MSDKLHAIIEGFEIFIDENKNLFCPALSQKSYSSIAEIKNEIKQESLIQDRDKKEQETKKKKKVSKSRDKEFYR